MCQVSVIIPVYGVEKWLPACLDSVLSQSLQQLEILAIDDASPDGCGRILDEYAAKDSRLRVFHLSENRQQGYGRNLGLKNAAGAIFICWMRMTPSGRMRCRSFTRQRKTISWTGSYLIRNRCTSPLRLPDSTAPMWPPLRENARRVSAAAGVCFTRSARRTSGPVISSGSSGASLSWKNIACASRKERSTRTSIFPSVRFSPPGGCVIFTAPIFCAVTGRIPS